MRKLWTLAAAGALALTTSAALAALCDHCKDNMYTKDMGTCQNCKQETATSGSHKLCIVCSGKLGECEHCRAKLKPAASAPASQPKEAK